MSLNRTLFVGGPLHGARLEIPDNLWRYAVQVPVELRVQHVGLVDPIPGPNAPLYALADAPEPVYYERTRWPYRVVDRFPPEEHMYVMLGPITEDHPPFHESVNDPECAYIADQMWRVKSEALIPQCVVPDCEEKGRYEFVADERGRLAGREWDRGDKIRICPEHASDIYRSQGVYGIEQLAEWLRPDARLDALDAYDAGADLLYGREIAASRARMLALRNTSRA